MALARNAASPVKKSTIPVSILKQFRKTAE
jgi:hypothetical protein